MTYTGIVRKLDVLGRLTLPSEIRKQFNITTTDSLEIFVDDSHIILKKYQPADIFSGSMDDLIDYHGQKVSRKSILEMAQVAGLKVVL
ncbi:MAG: AbrB family transcriptional regulator [Firmicutes bacterium HGW-Firmicutes-1]|jgi:transcriptional pleiotropic regulator of transition state genes|nr:MAG: AbrB family transcriptional regulator [Firmicutes bacterium HGW-Firmicutes-1]